MFGQVLAGLLVLAVSVALVIDADWLCSEHRPSPFPCFLPPANALEAALGGQSRERRNGAVLNSTFESHTAGATR